VGNQEALDAHAGKTRESSIEPRKLPPGPGLPPKQVAAHQLARIHKATIDIAAERGYQALKVRDIVRDAEVSTRAYYEHFSSKEDCFLQAYDLISRRATRRLIAAAGGEHNWRKRPYLVFKEFVRGLESEPASARVALVEAYAAGETFLEQAWRAERIFEGMLAESFARAPMGVMVPPMIVEGMVAGITTIARNRLLTNRVTELWEVGDDLVDWALSYPHQAAIELARLDGQTVWRDTTLEPLTAPWATSNSEPRPIKGDRALILAAVAELVTKADYSELTAARIRSAARVSRRKFDAHFDGLEDCYLAAIELRASEAMAQAARAQSVARSWAGGVYRAIAALCDHTTQDEFLAKVCLTDDFPAGLNGARSRQRLTVALTDLFAVGAPRAIQPAPLISEAVAGALWSLFHHHVVRDWSLRRQISATLSYVVLAPAIGAADAVAAIEAEQRG
jgi:AcrR family transcriptional regulator